MITKSNAVQWLTMWWDNIHWFPFIEDENGNITGPGHQNYSEFGIAVTRYYSQFLHEDDMELLGSIVDAIEYKWISPFSGEDARFKVVDEDYPGSIPVTTIWNLW